MKLICRLVGTALLLNVSTAALAQMPGNVKLQHPHVGVLQEDIDRLKNSLLPQAPVVFPATLGSLSFTFIPQRKAPSDFPLQSIFGIYQTSKSSFFFRHIDEGDSTNGKLVKMQFAMQEASYASYVAHTTFELPVGEESTIELSWNGDSNAIALKVNGELKSLTRGEGAPQKWSMQHQFYAFNGRAGELMKNFKLVNENVNENKKTVAEYGFLDLELQQPFSDYLKGADASWNKLQACPLTADPVKQDGSICDSAYQGRGVITESAIRFALAYRLTGKPEYMAAARRFADQILLLKDTKIADGKKIPLKLAVGGEWAMSSRVAAMGILYDWLYQNIDDEKIPGGLNTGYYRTRLAEAIKATITTDHPGISDDLVGAICGQYAQLSSSPFNCVGTMNWEAPGNPSIASYYITGHHQSAVAGTMQGLLAIASEDSSVLPLLNTLYGHFEKGFLPARAFVSVDGASHAGFAYGYSEMPERARIWRKSLENTGADPILSGDWMDQLIYPYIYGLRHDYSYPVSGDAFDFSIRDRAVGTSALAAIVDKQDPIALAFYRHQVKRARRVDKAGNISWDMNLILDRLRFPYAEYPETPVSDLPLSRHFRNAGFVLMRDSWDYPNATLLDFKSSSFISENHHHLDQNSFSLNYKAPLLLDTGLYEEYGSRHWQNYYTRTIAHNSIVVFDKDEKFIANGALLSNDGGQWFNGRPAYPTITEAKPGGSNALHGVTAYEEGGDYSYAEGNASRAYSAGKMKQDNGFVRSVLFLRESDRKPVVLVFDSVRTEKGLAASSLLHTAARPAHAVDTEALGDGRYRVKFAPNAARVATIRNGGGMLNVQMLLPQNADVVQVGSEGTAGSDCTQLMGSANLTPNVKDCRFMVRELQSDKVTYQWRNYPHLPPSQSTQLGDVGAWRLEISPAAAPAPGETQYFLNVLDVADNDRGTGPAAPVKAERLAAGDAGTEAVLVQDRLMVLFNRAATPASTYSWKASSSYGALIATGLKRNTEYALSEVAVTGGVSFKLEERVGGGLFSSKDGVLRKGR
ncbi:heparinase II/III family protein [Massilia sp. BJB1822]|uniref:heparinase II/III domain-containing protein n=1 Tax=Massilia sp. BJB1822 TaxID=2744470 RepID=UPI0015933178|nr:heparinase II/III family protein [Massilia sp. BJB1822]NVE00043.1 heparinase II/III family protein [Massilia sp. BJB1822]